jgi:hypothetical protein
MSAEFAIVLTVLCIGSMVACYRLGWREGIRQEKEREARWREFEDFED